MLTDDEIDSVASTFAAPGKVQASLLQAVDKQPDTEAKLQQLAKQYSLPVDAVRLNQNEVERRRKLDAVDVQALVADNPAVSNLFADPQKAAIAHDDVDNLTATETALKYAKMGASSVAATPFYVGSSVAGKIQEANELLASGADALGIPSGILKDYAGYYSALADQQKGIADTISEPAKGLIDSAVQSGFKSLAQNAAIAVPVAMTGGSAAIPVALMSMLTGGESYHKYRKAGVSPLQSAVHATADEAVEAITELPGMSILFDNLKIGSSWVKSVLASVVPEQIGEQWATVLQDYNEQITLHPEKSVSEFIKERPDAALQTAIATAIGQGGMVAIAESIDSVSNAGQKKVAQADRVANLLSHINDLAQASKVLQRDPQTYEQMLEMATEDGDASHVYIDAKALYQSGVADRLADLSPTVREQLSSSLGTIQIPTSEYGSRVAPTDVAQALVDHIKFDPDGFSRSEAAEFQKQFAEEQQAEIERALGNAQNDQVFADSAKTVGETIKQMLDATGFNANVKDANASFSTLMQNFYAVTAAKIGLSPEELYQQYPLQVTADGKLGIGRRLEQGGTFPESKTASFGEFVTGSPVTFDFSHNTESATKLFGKPKKGDQFQRDLEPSGRYVIQVPDASELDWHPNRVSGKLTFNNPLVLNADTWKKDLHDHYKKNGKQLSQALIADGYDGVVTVDKYGSSEILDLTTFDAGKALYQSAEDDRIADEDYRVLRRSYNDLLPDEQKAFDEFIASRSDGKEILDRLKEHVGTPWAKAAMEGIFVRQAIGVYADGGTPKFQSMFDHKNATKPRELVKKFGWDGVLMHVEYTGFVGDAAKPINNVSSTFINCNPSKDCAKYCYATEGHYRHVNSVIKSELVSLAVERDPARAAARTAAEYKVTTEFLNNKALRLFDKGDGSAEWLPFIKALNDEGIRVQIFSKVPEFLRQVPDINLRLLSVDESNMETADQNPDLPVAFVYSGAEGQVEFLAKLVERGQIQVVLPVKLGRKVFSNDQTKELKSAVPGIGKYICPIDGGIKKIGKTHEADKWNCTKCDKNGGLGCFFGKVTEQVMKSAEVKPLSSKEKAARILDLRRQINDLTNGNSTGDTAAAGSTGISEPVVNDGRDGQGHVQNLLREVDGLLGELLRDYEPDAETRNAFQGDGGAAQEVGRVQGDKSPTGHRVIPIKSVYQSESDQHRGSFSPDNLTITLFKSQNLSTFLHESGHFFLHMQMDLAARLQNQEDLKPGEQSLVDDANAIMQWFGLSSINDWYALDFEQQRAYHEKFAEGFETYLFEGKAPSIELQSVFQRFRAWLIGVYKSIKNMTEITPEIRGVMDRMIATSEQIALAERGRSMMPLFTREDAEAVGLTPEWFAEYQNLYINGTQDAIDDMQAKAMRDMAFSRNAHGRMFKKLQKLAEEKRREVRIGVRDEIMSRPVYRAWTFLTTPLGDTDKLPKPKKPKNDPNVVNPAVDSMATAIAKLGGLNKQELIDEWGIDPAYKPKSGVFGKPVLRSEGGLTREAMAEKLVEEGYLSADENGKHDLREFEDKLDEQLRGNDQFSVMFEPDGDATPGSQAANPGIIAAGRLDHGALLMMNIDDRFVRLLQERKMVASNGLAPDMVAGLLLDEEGNQLFDDGEHLIEALVNADDPKQVIEDETDVRMLEQYGELSSPAAIAKAADAAIYNDVRARMLAHEVNGLAQATGERKLLVPAAKSYAEQIVARTKVRDLTPGKYTSAAERAGKAAKKAREKGDMPVAVAEKRNQLINELAAKATTNAQEEIKKTLDYLRKFAKAAPGIDADYRDQIDQLLERYDLKPMTNKEADKRTALSAWLASQEKMGIAPDIPAYLTAAAAKESYKNLTVEELRGLRDAVKTIEHLGRLKNRLLTAQRNRDLIAAREEIVASIEEFASGVLHENRTEVTGSGIMVQGMLKFVASHYKVANLARIMDGGKDGGVVWEYFVRSANERSNYESTKRAWATKTLSEIMAPVLADGSFNTSMRVPNFNRRLTKQQIFVMALNTGNEGNLQRLTSGEQLTVDQIMPALKMLSATDWEAVQKIWNTFEMLRPEIAEKQKRVYGVEPNWVENKPFTLNLSNGSQVSLEGGYYPVKYDPRANEKADQQDAVTAAKEALSAAFRAPSTRRGHTKARADEVHNRPLLLSLDAMYSSFGTVIHDLAWHEWLIDMNRLMKGSVDTAIRSNYGADTMTQFTEWKSDIATGDGKMYDAATRFLGKMRQWVSVAGLGYNVVSAMMQPLGLTNSFVRVGYGWMGEGLRQFIGDIPGSIKHVEEKSEFVRNRFRTRFRELNELRNQVQNQDSPLRPIQENAYWMMLRAQQLVDTPTWLAAYAKAASEGNDDTRAIALADQAVIDSQGGGELKDLSAIERGSPASKLFTVFYTYMNTVYNLNAQVIRSDRSVAKKTADLLMLDVVPVVLGAALKAALTPSGDDWDWEDLAKSLIAEEIGWIMGLMVGVRELSDAGKVLLTGEGRDYQGPAGARLLVDVTKFAHESSQGEFDTGFRKATINLIGDVFAAPSAQLNRTWTGAEAIAEGKTSNPAALAFGFHK